MQPLLYLNLGETVQTADFSNIHTTGTPIDWENIQPWPALPGVDDEMRTEEIKLEAPDDSTVRTSPGQSSYIARLPEHRIKLEPTTPQPVYTQPYTPTHLSYLDRLCTSVNCCPSTIALTPNYSLAQSSSNYPVFFTTTHGIQGGQLPPCCQTSQCGQQYVSCYTYPKLDSAPSDQHYLLPIGSGGHEAASTGSPLYLSTSFSSATSPENSLASSTSPPSSDRPQLSKPNCCTFPRCTKSFARIDELKRHQRTHCDLKPFVCKFCAKGFTRSDHLRTHVRTHTGERPYSCDHCDRKFARSDEKTRHMRTHTRDPANCGVRRPRGPRKSSVRADHSAGCAKSGMMKMTMLVL